MDYQLLDSGNQRKFEKVGKHLLVRPCAQAVWVPSLVKDDWKPSATFTRDPLNRWIASSPLPVSWVITFKEMLFQITPTDFGHIGIFPEQAPLWEWMCERISKGTSILNLFAYTGGATIAALKRGATVSHVDASKAAVVWAKKNIFINKLEKERVRWITDDVTQFLRREIRRGVRYDGIILDPPTFGRGAKGEVFKIEKALPEILDCCFKLLSPDPRFVILSSHTPGYTPLLLHNLLLQAGKSMRGSFEWGELVIPGPLNLMAGSYARWYV